MKKKYVCPLIEVYPLEVEEGIASGSNPNNISIYSGNENHSMENLYLENFESASDGSSSSDKSFWF